MGKSFFVAGILLACMVFFDAHGAKGELIPPQLSDASFFMRAIRHESGTLLPGRVSGITVPHHLLATDVITHTFFGISNREYARVVLLSPDHFFLGTTDISATDKDFSTVFGTLRTDATLSRTLLQLPFVSQEDFFYREHGLQALTPFIRYYFPHATVVAVTFKETTPKAELDAFTDFLEKYIDADTLIIQSTDFSHYLSYQKAQERDAQTMRVLDSDIPSLLFSLRQPDNLDSIASQYVQMRLQRDVFHARPVILEHKNSQDYTREQLRQTTSYIAQAYVPFSEYEAPWTYAHGTCLAGRQVFKFFGERNPPKHYPLCLFH